VSAQDADLAARVIERLLADAAFRADFRRDPAAACREAGLDELAEEMSFGAGKAMHTLEVRESRSSLAGVMMAAAIEGIGVLGFVEHVVPAAAAVPGKVQDVLSRVNLPAVGGARGALAAPPAGAGAGPLQADASAGGASSSAGASAPAPVPAPAPVVAPPPQPEPPFGTGPGAVDTAKPPAAEASAPPAAHAPPADGPAAPQPAAATDAAPPAATPDAVAPGGGAPPSSEALALLDNKKLVLDPQAGAAAKDGRLDPRVVAVLTKLSEKHTIEVALSSDGQAPGVDITAVDGKPVNAGNIDARDIPTELAGLDPSDRPDRIGAPWPMSDKRYFTDDDHIHLSFKQSAGASATPPAGGGSGAAGAPGAAAGTAGAPGTAGAAAGGGPGAAGPPPGTLSLGVPDHPAAPPASATLGAMKVPGSAPGPSAAVAGTGAAAEQFSAGSQYERGGGAKAIAALREAMKFKGTPYLWGGSRPQTGFDCSGLVQWAYAKQGIQIPRVTDQQILASNGSSVDRKDLVPGDLVFFRDPSGYVHHVGISMGGDKFLHAPHTGDVVKESSLDEPYYSEQFAGGRRFDATAAGAPMAAPAPAAVDAAGAALARDAAAVRNPNSLIFKALTKQEASHHNATVRFMPTVRPEDAPQFQRVAAAAASLDPFAASGSLEYPGDGASKEQLAAWLGAQAENAGLPRELPVMAALVESGVANLAGGDADSAGFFQMRVGIWDTGDYAGYRDHPELQAKWFIDHALAVKKARLAAGDSAFGKDPATWGNWIADVENPAAQFRYRYAERLEEARRLLGGTV
jgi:cell wall-associated NlpC family hydrolase